MHWKKLNAFGFVALRKCKSFIWPKRKIYTPKVYLTEHVECTVGLKKNGK
jgi:hypothetical protein